MCCTGSAICVCRVHHLLQPAPAPNQSTCKIPMNVARVSTGTACDHQALRVVLDGLSKVERDDVVYWYLIQ
jgi:hypothetical protein